MTADNRQHEASVDCWCKPELGTDEWGKYAIHREADGTTPDSVQAALAAGWPQVIVPD